MNRLALLMLLAIPMAQAPAMQQTAASQSLDRPAEPNMVFDDDGGKTQIVPADLSTAAEKKFHGGEIMKSVQQVSIFLGSTWGDREVRTRETALLDLGATHGAHLAELQAKSVKLARAAQGVEDFADLTKTRVNDLTIQRKLADMLAAKVIPQPTPNTVYVIYLGPGINSTLGAHKAGTDYAAYHNYVHLDAGEVRYVVVPFHQDANHHGAAAARAFADSALNPNGMGWY
jgi:hypothetical protein